MSDFGIVPSMVRNRALSAINLFFCLVFGYLFFVTVHDWKMLPSLNTSFDIYLLLLFYVLSFVCNGILAYRLLKKKEKHFAKKDLIQTLVLSFAPLFWFALIIIGFYFASEITFPIVMILFSVVCFLFLFKVSKRLAFYIALMTIFMTGYVILESFQEDYCWKKGDQADRNTSGSTMVKATAADAKALSGWDVKKGQMIGVAFRAHMLCHENFNWSQALREKYL